MLGELAQLARAPALHAGGQGFDSLILHFYSSFFNLKIISSDECPQNGNKKGSTPLFSAIRRKMNKFFDILEVT
jgi:hypothetical protein